MRIRSAVIPFVAVLGLGLGLLRIHGAYQNEQSAAVTRATQAAQRAELEELQSARDAAELACSKAWNEYRIAELDAEYIRMTVGQLAYDKARLKLLRLKPLWCDSELSHDAFVRVLSSQLAHDEAAAFLKALAAAERRYASDRKLQTRRIWHMAWAKLTGTAPATDEEWVAFLARSYGGALGELVNAKNGSAPPSH